MKLLREAIRKLILESANTKLSHAMKILQDRGLSVSIRTGPEAFLVQILEDGEQVGYISAEKPAQIMALCKLLVWVLSF